MKLYIIPAYEDTIRNQGYGRIIAEAKKQNYEIIVLNLQIKGRLLSDLVDEGINTIGQNTNCVVFGFSIGALVAFLISKKLPIKKGLFCSVSPILNEDIPKNEKLYISHFGKEAVKEMKKTKYGKSLAKESIFFCGDKEGRKMITRTRKICEASHGNLVVVKNNDHELNKIYTREIIKLL